MSNGRASMRGIAYAGGRIPGFGFARTADSISTNGVNDAAAFGDAGQGKGDFSKAHIYRPAQADPNRVKRGSVVSGDRWTHEAAGYTDALTDLSYEAVGWLDPDTVNECARLCLRHIYFPTYMPLTPWDDGDFASASLTAAGPNAFSWTAASVGTTVTKDTTGPRNPSGKRSIVLTNAGYVTTSSAYPSPGDQFFHGCDSSAETGATFTYSLLDVTHGTTIYTASHSSRGFRHIMHNDTIPAGCYEVKAKFQTAGGVSVVDTTFGHVIGGEQRNLTAPESLTEAWRLFSFGPATYGRAIVADQFNTLSRDRQAWKDPADFALYPLLAEARQYTLQIRRRTGLEAVDYWYFMQRPWSDVDELTDEDGRTDAPEDLLMPAFYYELGIALQRQYRNMPEWKELTQDNWAVLQSQRKARTVPAPEAEPTVYIPGGRGGGRWANPSYWP